MCGLLQPGAVQQVLEGGGHVQVLVNGEGHAVVQVVEQVVHPLVDGAHRVVHGNLQSAGERGSQGVLLTSLLGGWGAVALRPHEETGWQTPCASFWAQLTKQTTRSDQ